MKKMKIFSFSSCALALSSSLGSAATITGYDNQASFEADLNASFTLVDFDDAAFAAGPLVASDARLLGLGLDVVTADSRGFTTQSLSDYPANQGPGPNVRVLFNGSRTSDRSDDFTVNFVGGANGFGYAGNLIDGGIIEFYSGEDLTGSLLGSVSNTGDGTFTGGISDMSFRSARITCDFNGDFTCGVTDLQFGTLVAPVPLPAGLPLLASGFGVAALVARRKTG
jgi:hypothetical protein